MKISYTSSECGPGEIVTIEAKTLKRVGLIHGDKFYPEIVLDFKPMALNYFVPPKAHVLNSWYQLVPEAKQSFPQKSFLF